MKSRQPSRRAALGLLGAIPVAAAGGLATVGSAHADTHRGTPWIPRDALPGGAYDRYFADLAKKDVFSGTVLLAYRGRSMLARAYGMADRERTIANRIDTIFCLASGSKPFTTLAILQLAQQRKVDLYRTLGAFLDGFRREIADTVTVHHLLSHTSGLGDYRDGDLPAQKTYHSIGEQLADTREFLRELHLGFAPGTQVGYSSHGMDVLSEIVAKVSGQPFWDYVHDHIFKPAGMRRSKYYTRAEWLDDRNIAHPYMLQESGERIDAVRNLDKGGLPVPGTEIPGGLNSARDFIGYGGGMGFSTAPDMVRFTQAVQENKLLNRAYTRLYLSARYPTAPMPGTDPDPASQAAFMGYGPISAIFNNQAVITHAGGITGGSTFWSSYLDLGWTGVILSNYDYGPDTPGLRDAANRERHTITDNAPTGS